MLAAPRCRNHQGRFDRSWRN